MMTKEELIAFEEEIAQLFNEGKIKSPIHLSRGNEDELIRIFADIKPTDYVLSNHRSHYHALLKSNDKEWVKSEILANHSINLNSAKYRFFSSAIVAGICPIAVGVAMGLKLQGSSDKVWCFVGDAAAETGIFYEAAKYAKGHDLPLVFVCECNEFAVNSPTYEVWGVRHSHNIIDAYHLLQEWEHGKVISYCYNRTYPHSGSGEWIRF